MTAPSPPTEADEPDDHPRLAELVERVTREFLAGGSLDAEAILARDLDQDESIRALLPTIRDLAELGRDHARDRRRNPLFIPRPPDPESDRIP